MRILLIEDDDIIGEGIKLGLSKQNMAVDWFRDGKLGLNASDSVRYDAVILDLSLPGMDGLAILRQWRQSGNNVPVLILTARGTLEQRVEGLNLGADDYLSKPFALEELAARVHALVRRSHEQPAPLLCHGEVCLDTATRTVFLAGEPVSLSGKAVALVELFLQHKHQILSREAIEEKLYPWGEEVSSNAVEVHIHNIRRKLGNSFIRTVYGAGYRLGDNT